MQTPSSGEPQNGGTTVIPAAGDRADAGMRHRTGQRRSNLPVAPGLRGLPPGLGPVCLCVWLGAAAVKNVSAEFHLITALPFPYSFQNRKFYDFYKIKGNSKIDDSKCYEFILNSSTLM